jgi:Flp pilus assembly protein TadD
VRAGDPEAAIFEFHKALAIQPNSAPMHAGLAVAYSASIGDFAASDAEFEVAQKIDPADPLVLADLSYVKRLRARLDRELDLAAARVRDQPSNGTAHGHLAFLLLRQGKVEQSISEAREAIKMGPESWPMHYTLAEGLYANHDPAGASAELARAKKLGSGARPHLEELLRAAVPPKR